VRLRLLLSVLSLVAVLTPAGARAEEASPPPSVGKVGRVEVSPAPDAELSWSPKEIVLRFPASATGVTVTLETAEGFPLPPAAPVVVEGGVLRYPNPQIYAGTYTVRWDGPDPGSYDFIIKMRGGFESVGPSEGGVASTESDAATISSTTSSSPTSGSRWFLLPGAAVFALLVVLLRRRPLLAGGLAVLLLGTGYLLFSADTGTSENRSRCLPLSGEERLACLNVSVLAGFDDGGVRSVVAALHELEQDVRFRSEYGENVCHTVAHMAARVVVARAGSISEVAKEADLLCASGFLHGAIEGGAPFVSTEVFTDEVLGICGNATDNAALECSHGIGHGAALRLNSRLPEAVDICLQLANEPQAVQCILGAAMLSGNWIGNMAARDPDPERFTPPGLPTGTIGDVCLDEDLVLEAERFRACLEGVFFYMKPGPVATSRLAAPWDSVDSIASWCVEVTDARTGLEVPCFSGVGSASALRLEEEPSTMASPCAKARTDEAQLTCIESVVTQVRNNQDVSPPRTIFEEVCAAVPTRFTERCLSVSDRLINR
jgi:hypothetical protein